MAVITARIPDKKKEEAQKLAKELWLSLSSLINVWVNQFLRTKSISVKVSDTHPAFYEGEEALPVNEEMDVVIDFLEKSLTDKDFLNG